MCVCCRCFFLYVDLADVLMAVLCLRVVLCIYYGGGCDDAMVMGGYLL